MGARNQVGIGLSYRPNCTGFVPVPGIGSSPHRGIKFSTLVYRPNALAPHSMFCALVKIKLQLMTTFMSTINICTIKREKCRTETCFFTRRVISKICALNFQDERMRGKRGPNKGTFRKFGAIFNEFFFQYSLTKMLN